jgi:hypothetical protein
MNRCGKLWQMNRGRDVEILPIWGLAGKFQRFLVKIIKLGLEFVSK